MIKVMEGKSIVSADNWSIPRIVKEASNYDSVLDIGCGCGFLITDVIAKQRIGIDICEAAIKEAKILHTRKRLKISPVKYIIGDISNLICNVKMHVECVLGVDVIEHFCKKDAISLIGKCEFLATKKVIFFIPVGNHPQTTDDRGFDNDYYQTHRSTWYPKDMEDLGYDVYFYPNWHKFVPIEKDKGAMFCIKTLG